MMFFMQKLSLICLLLFSFSSFSQTKEEIEKLKAELENELKQIDKEIERTDKLINEHDKLIKDVDDNIEKIDQIIDSTYIPQKIPLLKAPTTPLTDEQRKKAKRDYLDGEVTYWFNNILSEDLTHQVFVNYVVQVEGIKPEQIPNFTESFKKMLWKNFYESQREDMLQVLVDSKMEVHKISKHQIAQAWDYAMNKYVKRHNLKQSPGFNPGFSIYNYKDKERIN